MNKNVKLNITAIMTIKQVEELCRYNDSTPIIISCSLEELRIKIDLFLI